MVPSKKAWSQHATVSFANAALSAFAISSVLIHFIERQHFLYTFLPKFSLRYIELYVKKIPWVQMPLPLINHSHKLPKQLNDNHDDGQANVPLLCQNPVRKHDACMHAFNKRAMNG